MEISDDEETVDFSNNQPIFCNVMNGIVVGDDDTIIKKAIIVTYNCLPNDEYDKTTGHKKDCHWNKTTNKIIAKCAYNNKDGEICDAEILKHSCLEKSDDGNLYGYCYKHYKRFCENDWTYKLSICANKKCDELNMSKRMRNDIMYKNIKMKIGISGRKNHNHIIKSPKHISKSKTHNDDYQCELDNIIEPSNIMTRGGYDRKVDDNKKRKIDNDIDYRKITNKKKRLEDMM